MNSLSYERLYYYLARLDELRESREDIGLRRARADGLITDLLRELAHVLSEDERILVLAIVGKHEKLWSFSSSERVMVIAPNGVQPMERIVLAPLGESQNPYYRLQPLIDAYQIRWSQSPIESARRLAYGFIVSDLKSRLSLPWAVESTRKSLKGIERKLSYVSEKQKPALLEEKAVCVEFVSYYANVE